MGKRITKNPARSVRVDSQTWEQALRRANGEGLTISQVIQRFVQGYGEGVLTPPKFHLVYATSAADSGAEDKGCHVED